MKLIGVPHLNNVVEEVDRYIDETHPEGIESLMVELPPNWHALSRLGFFDGFFDELAKRHEKRGTRIIYGDRRRKISETSHLFRYAILRYLEVFKRAIEELTTHKPSKGMVEAIKDEEPQVVVVGAFHSNYIKKIFPDAYYVVFDTSAIFNPFKPYQPNLVIPLQN